MERNYKVADRVLASVKGFEPWPATIDSVVSEEKKRNVSYHVRLDGSYKSVPINVRCLKPLKPNDEKKWRSMCVDERWHGARKRNEVVEGIYIDLNDNGDLPPTLWNFVSADSDYENVPDVDKANLKLSRVAHNAKVRYSELEAKFTFHTLQNKMLWGKKDDAPGTVVDETRRKSTGDSEPKTVIRFRCPTCSKKYKTRMALKKHMEYSSACNESKSPSSKPTDIPQQCPTCFALYKNEEALIKHMAVHDKTLSKKKNGIRDYIRQAMSTNKSRMGSYHSAVKNKATTIARTVPRVPDPKRSRKVSSPEDSEEESESDDNSASDADSWRAASRNCSVCRLKYCTCSRKNGHRNHELHSEKEKERRFLMRIEFQNLANVLGLDKGSHPKQTLLTHAKEELLKLAEAGKKLEQTLNDLRDMNVRLVSREYQLNLQDHDV